MWAQQEAAPNTFRHQHQSSHTCINEEEEGASGETNASHPAFISVYSHFWANRPSCDGRLGQILQQLVWGQTHSGAALHNGLILVVQLCHNCKPESQSGRQKLLLSGGNDGSCDPCVINGLVWNKVLLLPAKESDLNLIVMTPEDIRAARLTRLFEIKNAFRQWSSISLQLR